MTVDFIQSEGFVAEISTTILSLQGMLKGYADDFNLVLENGIQKKRDWTDIEAMNYVEYLINNDVENTTLVFDTHVFDNYSNTRGEAKDIVCLDGLQRIRAFEKYVNGEIRIAGKSFSSFEEFNAKFKIKILFVPFNNDKDKAEAFLKLNAQELCFSEVDRIADEFNVDVSAFNNEISEVEAISVIEHLLDISATRKNDDGKEVFRLFQSDVGSAERLNDALYLAYRNNCLSEKMDQDIKYVTLDIRMATKGGETYTFLSEEERQKLNMLKEAIVAIKNSKLEGELLCQ